MPFLRVERKLDYDGLIACAARTRCPQAWDGVGDFNFSLGVNFG
jgi:hypothetical protein